MGCDRKKWSSVILRGREQKLKEQQVKTKMTIVNGFPATACYQCRGQGENFTKF